MKDLKVSPFDEKKPEGNGWCEFSQKVNVEDLRCCLTDLSIKKFVENLSYIDRFIKVVSSANFNKFKALCPNNNLWRIHVYRTPSGAPAATTYININYIKKLYIISNHKKLREALGINARIDKTFFSIKYLFQNYSKEEIRDCLVNSMWK